jgi:hypothetical protein
VWLTWAGVIFELVGLGVVAWEIWGDRRAARQIIEEHLAVDLKREVRVSINVAKPRPGPATMRDLENLPATLQAERDARKELGEELRQQIEVDRNELVEKLSGRDRAIREAVAAQVKGSVHLRVFGAVCIANGVLLAAPANLVG